MKVPSTECSSQHNGARNPATGNNQVATFNIVDVVLLLQNVQNLCLRIASQLLALVQRVGVEKERILQIRVSRSEHHREQCPEIVAEDSNVEACSICVILF